MNVNRPPFLILHEKTLVMVRILKVHDRHCPDLFVELILMVRLRLSPSDGECLHNAMSAAAVLTDTADICSNM